MCLISANQRQVIERLNKQKHKQFDDKVIKNYFNIAQDMFLATFQLHMESCPAIKTVMDCQRLSFVVRISQ